MYRPTRIQQALQQSQACLLYTSEFDLTVLAAVLAVIGYSVNDTVVVLDRIRENFRKRRKGSVLEIMNLSINETLSRTTMTSFVTLLSVIVMYFFGGTVMHGFSCLLYTSRCV